MSKFLTFCPQLAKDAIVVVDEKLGCVFEWVGLFESVA